MGSKSQKGIDGVVIRPLKIINDDRGAVLHMLRSDCHLFSQFGEVYFSEVNPGVIKGWKRHQRMTQNFAVPIGEIKLVIFDQREKSTSYGCTMKIIIGRQSNYQIIQVAPMLWYSFENLSDQPSILANCTDMPHDPSESETMDLSVWEHVHA